MPATTLERAFVDLAADDGERVLGWAWKEAEFLRILDPLAIRRELATTRRPGAALVHARLANHRVVTTVDDDVRSRREVAFLHLIAEAGLPAPEINARLVLGGAPYYPDFLYRELGLVVELDGGQHLQPQAGENDRARDIEFFVAGLDVLRLLEVWIDERPRWCVERLATAIERQRRRTAAPQQPAHCT